MYAYKNVHGKSIHCMKTFSFEYTQLIRMHENHLPSEPPSPTTISMLSIDPFNEDEADHITPLDCSSLLGGISGSASMNFRQASITPLALFSRSLRGSFPFDKVETRSCDSGTGMKGKVPEIFVFPVEDEEVTAEDSRTSVLSPVLPRLHAAGQGTCVEVLHCGIYNDGHGQTASGFIFCSGYDNTKKNCGRGGLNVDIIVCINRYSQQKFHSVMRVLCISEILG